MGRLLFTALAVLLVVGASRIPVAEMPASLPMGEVFGPPSPIRFSVIALGLAPLWLASALVELASLLVPAWRRLREAAGQGEVRRRRVAVALGLGLAAWQAWGAAGALSVIESDFHGQADPSLMVALTIAAGSAFLLVLASLVERHGTGSGLLTVQASLAFCELGLGRTALANGADVAALLLSSALILWALTWTGDKDAPGRPSEALSPRIPEPVGGVTGYLLATVLLEATPLLGDPQLTAWLHRTAESGGKAPMSVLLGAAVAGILGAAAAWLFAWPRRVAKLWARSEPGASADDLLQATQGDVRDAAVRAGLLSAGLFCSEAALLGLGGRMTVQSSLFLGLAAFEVLRDRRARGELSVVDEEPRAWAAAAKKEALARAGLAPVLRGLSLATVVPLVGPLGSVVLLVPHAQKADAERVLARLRETERAASEATSAPPLRVERRAQPSVLVGVGLALISLGGAGVPVLLRPPEVADAEVRPVELQLRFVDDSIAPFQDDDAFLRSLPPGAALQLEDAPLGPGRTSTRGYVLVESTPETSAEALRDQLAPKLAALLPPGASLAWGVVYDRPDDPKEEPQTIGYRTWVLTGDVIFTQTDVTAAVAAVDDSGFGDAQVSISLTPEAAERFAEATRRWINKRIAIVVDGEVKTAPVVQSEITGGQIRITMGAGRTEQRLREAEALARSLRPAR